MALVSIAISFMQIAAIIVMFMFVRSTHRRWLLALRREYRLSRLAEAMAEYASAPSDETLQAVNRVQYETMYEYQTQDAGIGWRQKIPDVKEDWV